MNENKAELVNTNVPSMENTKTPVLKFDGIDKIFALGIFILAVIGTKYYSLTTGVGKIGLGATIYAVFYVVLILLYARLKGIRIGKEGIILSVLIVLLAASFTLTYNYSLNEFVKIILNFMLIYFPVTVFGLLLKKETSSLIFFDYINALIFIPKRYLNSFWLCIFSKKNEANESNHKLLNIVWGLFVGSPIMLIVVFLLSKADTAFGKIFSSAAEFAASVGKDFWTFIWAVPLAMYLFSLLYGSFEKSKTGTLGMDKLKEYFENLSGIPRLSIYTVNAVLCLFYLIFICIQAVYFIDILSGRLPEDFTYAEYARRGFFELLSISLINIGIIWIAKLLTLKADSNKYMRIHISLISSLTLVLICVALAKMYLYIYTYGLTPLRIVPSVFMIFLIFVFVFILIAEFKEGFPLTKYSFYVGAGLFAILSLVNMDAVVANYNLNEYVDGRLPYYNIMDLYESDIAAVPAIYKVWNSTKNKEIKEELYMVVSNIYSYMEEDKDYNLIRKQAEVYALKMGVYK